MRATLKLKKVKEWRIPLWWLVNVVTPSTCHEPCPHIRNPTPCLESIPTSGTHLPCLKPHPHVWKPLSLCQELHPHVWNPILMSGTPSHVRNPILMLPCLEPHPHVRNATPCLEPHPHVWNPTPSAPTLPSCHHPLPPAPPFQISSLKVPSTWKGNLGFSEFSKFSNVRFNLTSCGFNLTSRKIISFTSHGKIPKIVVQQPRFHL